VFLFAQIRHALPQLGKRDQFFLIRCDHAVNMVLKPRLLVVQCLFTFSKRICVASRFHSAIDFGLDQCRLI
jgi:hypothetical protein